MGDWTRWPPPFRTFVGILHESAGAVRIVGDLRSLVRLLVDILSGRTIAPVSVTLPHALVVRASTARVRV